MSTGEVFSLKRLEVENVFSYERAVVEFDKGLTAFAGHNGSGKTSLIESILLALTLDTKAVRSEIVRRVGGKPAGQGRISLTLEGSGGTRYVVRLVVANRKRRDEIVIAELVEENVNGSRKLRASGVSAVRSELARILGFHGLPDYSSFLRHSIFAQQGYLREIAERLGNERAFRELIEDALGLKNLQDAITRLSNISVRSGFYAVQLGSARSLRKSPYYRRIVSELENARKRLSEARSRAEKARRRREELQAVKEEVAGRLREAERASGALERVKNEIRSVREELQRHERRLLELSRERRKLEKRLSEIEARKSELEKLASLAEIADLIGEYKEVKAEVAELEFLESNLRAKISVARDLAKYRGAAERYKEVESRLREIEEEIRKLERYRDSLENIVNQSQIFVGKLARIAKRWSIKWDGGTPGVVVATLQEKLERARKEVEEFEEELRRLIDQRSSTAAKLEEAMKALEALRSSTRPSCPVCGRPLDEAMRIALGRRLANEVETLQEELEALDEKISFLEDELGRARKRVEALERALSDAASVASAVESLLASKGFASLDEVKAELDRVVRELSRLASERKTLEREKKRLEQAYTRYLAAIQNAERLGVDVDDLERLEAEYKEVYTRLEAERKKLGRLETEILEATGARSIIEAEDKVKRASRAKEELTLLEKEASTLRSRLYSLKEAEEETTVIIGELKNRLDSLEKEAEELEEVASQLEKLRVKLRDVEREIEEAASEESSSVKEAEQASEIIKAYEDLKRKFVAGMAARVILAKVQEAAYEAAVSRLIDEMNAFLAEFGLNISRVERADSSSFRLVVYREGNSRTEVGTLSGGEKSALALAFLMAFNRVVGGRLSFLVLDEPTAELDEDRRRVLMDLLRRMSLEGAVSQVIVVAHHDDVLDLADRGCRVRYERGRGSVVEC